MVQVRTGENRQSASEKDILERVAEKFKTHLKVKKKPITAAVQFDRRRQQPGETFDTFVTDLKLLARRLDIAERDRQINLQCNCVQITERTGWATMS